MKSFNNSAWFSFYDFSVFSQFPTFNQALDVKLKTHQNNFGVWPQVSSCNLNRGWGKKKYICIWKGFNSKYIYKGALKKTENLCQMLAEQKRRHLVILKPGIPRDSAFFSLPQNKRDKPSGCNPFPLPSLITYSNWWVICLLLSQVIFIS